MSIIYDALKKVQNKTQASVSSSIDLAKNAQLVSHKRKSKSFLILLLVIFLGIVLGKVLFVFLSKEEKQNPKPAALTSSVEKIPLVNNTGTSSKEETTLNSPFFPSLILNGVFFTENEAYALINNQVFKKNDVVQGAKIVEITPKSVDLVFEGENFTLKVD